MLLATFVGRLLVLSIFFATEENEEKREIREKQKERKDLKEEKQKTNSSSAVACYGGWIKADYRKLCCVDKSKL